MSAYTASPKLTVVKATIIAALITTSVTLLTWLVGFVMETADGNGAQLILLVILWSEVLWYPILQFIAIKRMHGVWRVLAFLPFVPMALLLAIAVVGIYQQSNLWPIALIFVSPLILVYLVVLLGLHWFVVRGKNEQQKQT